MHGIGLELWPFSPFLRDGPHNQIFYFSITLKKISMKFTARMDLIFCVAIRKKFMVVYY